MNIASLLLELFERIPVAVGNHLEGLDGEDLRRGPNGANTIGWLGWHLTRVLDHHIADAFHLEEIWVRDGWAPLFGLPLDAADTGYGHTPQQAAAVVPRSVQTVLGYLHASHARACVHLGALEPHDLDRIVDTSWDPPVTLGVRLISVAGDCLEHAGQLGYARGLIEPGAGPVGSAADWIDVVPQRTARPT